MKIWKEKPGIISTAPCWCGYSKGYLYIHGSFAKLVWQMLTEWKNDKHLVG